ncbi:guanylate kinase [Dethiosulfovibrio salsuginis]|uniref:Guanylate kinase n=1 Tax=Dethiosulfovibrio salsuginis TaxID=561720 RepID=A0A1X7IBG3_9BACT|nr:guanylate kinase [Dethiosulfovibrio salsuginis]SMG11424.1 guanylate kinase [Dethiosulfovibrio salsuginis]
MDERGRGLLFVLSGPSGAGKGTVRKEVFRRIEGLSFSISCTTRLPRKGEKDGIDYRFISRESFLELVDRGEFLEWAEVHGNLYGTLWHDVDKILDDGRDVLLEIDVQGALQVMNKCDDVVSIFLSPPSTEELERRLRARGSEDDDTIALRLKNALKEMEELDKYDHVVINDDLNGAVVEMERLVGLYRGDDKRRVD